MSFVHIFKPSPSGSSGTFLALHGTGGNEHDLIPLVTALDPNAAVLSPRGRIDENGALRFFTRLAEGVFDQDDLRLQTEDLADFVVESSARHRFDLRHLIAVGFSNGANMAASLLLRRPEVLGSAVLFRAMMPFVPEIKPDLAGTRVLLASGVTDPYVPEESASRLAALLEDCGALVDHRWFDTGHNLTSEDVEAAKVWLKQGY